MFLCIFLQFVGTDHNFQARLGFQQNVGLFLPNPALNDSRFTRFEGGNLHFLWSLLQPESIKFGPSCEGKKMQDGEMFGTGPSNFVLLSSYTGC